MGEKEGNVKSERRGSKNRKIASILMVIILLQVSFISIWYVYYRPWTIRDVARNCNVNFDGIYDYPYFPEGVEEVSPSFSSYIAGDSRMVKGRITDISSHVTTLGPLTNYELDNFEHLHLIEWAPPNYKIGDVMAKRVYFEWSRWNRDENVYSPQLDFPALITALEISQLIDRISLYEGLTLEVVEAESEMRANISVFLRDGVGFPLELFNCSLREGVSSWMEDYHDISAGYWRNPIIDSVQSLLNRTGDNNQIEFTDADSNGILDNGDYFAFNLTKPEEDSGILTYCFSINEGMGPFGRGVIFGQCYIIMTNRGVFKHISYSDSRSEMYPIYTMEIMSEARTVDGIETAINVTQVIGEVQEISELDMHFTSPGSSFSGHPLNEVAHIGFDEFKIESSDDNGNGKFDAGDRIVMYKLQELDEYEFKISGPPYGGTIGRIRWRSGIGVYTGFLPIMELSGNALGNDSHEVTIDRMYGIPGLNLDHNDLNRGSIDHWRSWLMIHLEKDEIEILSPINLTLNFNVTAEGLYTTFLDADSNGFINTGDGFLFEGIPGSYRLILDYVQRDREAPEGFRVVHSLSYSWDV